MVLCRALCLVGFTPHHFVDHARVGLDDLDHLGGHVLLDIGGHGDAVVAVLCHGDGGGDGVQQVLLVDAREDKARLIQCLGALGRGADADRREGMADRGEEGAFLGQSAAVGDHGKGVHLQAVVIVEAEGLVLNDARVKLEAACRKAVS